jgi:hypothetical protein
MVGVLLWLVAYLRWHDVAGFPVFVDEAYLLDRMTPAIQRGSVLVEGGGNRMFLAWWVTLLHVGGEASIAVGRFAVALLSLLGVAGVIGTARLLGGRASALGAGFFVVLMPYDLFFSRLILPDSTLAVFAVLCVWGVVAYVQHRRVALAVFAGVALGLALASKQTGLFFFGVPVAAVFLLWGAWRAYARLWAGILLGFGALWLPLGGLLVARGYHYFADLSTYGSGDTVSLFDRLGANVRLWWAMQEAWVGGVLVLLTVVSLAAWAWRDLRALLRRRGVGAPDLQRAVFIMLVTFAPLLAALATATSFRSRYVAFFPPLLAVAVGVGAWAMGSSLLVRRAGVVVALLWAAVVALPFHTQLHRDAGALRLHANDAGEYLQSESAGFGLSDAVAYLRDVLPADGQVAGVVANCAGLRLMLSPDVPTTCVDYDYFGENSALDAQLNALAETLGARLFVVQEDLSYAPLKGRAFTWDLLATFARPYGGREVRVYRVRP